MRLSQFLIRGALCLAAFAGVVGAQTIAVLTGAQGASTDVQLYNANPEQNPSLVLRSTASGVPAGAFQILASPNGLKYYVLSNTAQGITTFGTGAPSPTPVGTAIPGKPVKAVITPDGTKLIVLAGTSDSTVTAYVMDLATGTVLNPNGVTIAGGGTATDVVVGMDSQTMYVLSKTSSGASLTPVALSPAIVAGTALNIPSTNITGIVAGPSGFLYVTGTNAVFEIKPGTPLKITPGKSSASPATIPVNGTPGKLLITPDGAHAYAVNGSTNGPAYFIFDLAARTVKVSTSPNLGGAVIDQAFLLSNDRLLLYSSQNQMLYEGSTAGGFGESRIKNILANGTVGSVAVSNEVNVKTVYLSALANGVNTLYQVDAATNTQLATLPMPDNGSVVAWAGVNPTSGAAAITAFNTTQTIEAGAKGLPLVARVLDAAGRPVFGATVNFSALAGGVTLSGSAANTNLDGYAFVNVTAGANSGTFTVQASLAGASTQSYTITVPGSSTGPCTENCNPTPTNLTIISGNGQIVAENTISTELVEVAVKDASGNPVANQLVVFSASAQDPLTLLCLTPSDQSSYPNSKFPAPTKACEPDPDNANTRDVYTDAAGLAAIKFVGQSLFGTGTSFVSSPVTATTVIGNTTVTVNFSEVTIQLLIGSSFNAVVTAPIADSRGAKIVTGNAGDIIEGAIQADVYAILGPTSSFPIPGVALNVSGAATCVNGPPLTNASGHVSCDLQLGSTVSSSPIALTTNIGNYIIPTTPILVVIKPGQPPKVKIVQGDGQSGQAGTQFLLKALVTTAAGNASASTPITWKVTQGSGSLSNQSTQTDSQGYAQATLTLGSTPGKVMVQVTAGSGSIAASANFSLTVVPTVVAGAIKAVSGDGQNTTPNAAFGQPLVVQVTDTSGAPMPGVQVTFSGSGVTLGTPTSSTDSNGKTQTNVSAGSSTGTFTVTASAGSLQAAFTLTVAPPGPSIDATSFRNAASGAQGLTPCGIATVTGSGLAPGVNGTVLANAIIGPLPTSLADVSIAVNGIPAPIFWVSNTPAGGEAVAFQTPCEASAGVATVAVTVSGTTKSVPNVSVVAVQPGIFETVIDGKRFAVLLHVSDGSYVTPENPARRGEQLKMFVTGLGPVTPATATNRVGLGDQIPVVSVVAGLNNGGVPVIGSEYMPGAIGLYTITFSVPSDTQTGPYQNLGLQVFDPAAPTTAIYANGSFVPIS